MINLQGDYYLVRNDRILENAINHLRSREIGKGFSITISNKKEPRTKRQNRFIWGWVYPSIVQKLEDSGISIPLADGSEYPYDAEILHEIFKKKLLVIESKVAIRKSGETVEIPIFRSTTKLTKKEFSGYTEGMEKFVYGCWGFTVPQPAQGYWADFYKDLI